MQKKLHIKVGDTVKVLTGEYRSKEGQILKIDRKKERAIVSGINIVKKHIKPTSTNPQGQIVETEAGVHISNLMVVTKDGPTRIGRRKNEDGKSVRYSKKTGQEIK